MSVGTARLSVKATLDTNEYPTGVKVSKAEFSEINIRFHATHPSWNYTIKPSVGKD